MGKIDYIFNQTDHETIIADVSKSNIGSVKVLQKFLQGLDPPALDIFPKLIIPFRESNYKKSLKVL